MALDKLSAKLMNFDKTTLVELVTQGPLKSCLRFFDLAADESKGPELEPGTSHLLSVSASVDSSLRSHCFVHNTHVHILHL